MNSIRIVPVSTRVSRMIDCDIAIYCDAMVSLTRSIRSATAPAMGETMTDGARLQNAMTPTHSVECVRVQAIQSVAIRCTQDPVQHTTLPE